MAVFSGPVAQYVRRHTHCREVVLLWEQAARRLALTHIFEAEEEEGSGKGGSGCCHPRPLTDPAATAAAAAASSSPVAAAKDNDNDSSSWCRVFGSTSSLPIKFQMAVAVHLRGRHLVCFLQKHQSLWRL